MIQENFIEENIGNYKDCIENIIYKLQRYSDLLMINLDGSIASTNPFLLSSEFIGFLRCENDEILNQKMLKSAVEICNTISRKHNLYQKMISCNYNKNLSYTVSNDAFSFMENELSSIDWLALSSHYHYICKSDKNMDCNLYNFNSYLNEIRDEYEETFSKMKKTVQDSEHTLFFCNNSRFIVYMTVRKLKGMIELSPSCYYSAIIIRQMIKVLVLGYETMLTIKIVEE